MKSLAQHVKPADVKMLSVKEVASVMGCCEVQVRRMIRAGTIPSYRIGQTYRIEFAELLRALRTSAKQV